MLKVFKKKINPLHSLRDYEDQFSSKNDVLSPLSESRLLVQKSPTNLAKHFSTTKGNGSMWGAKSMNKNNTTTFADKHESENMDDLDSSFRKRKAEFHFHKKTFVFCKRSLYIFDESNKLRRFAVWLTEHKMFELATIALILFNAILLGLRDYTDDDDKETNANKIYDYTAAIFIIYYVVEAALKIIARGFMNESNSYLRTGWNWVDLFVAVSGIFYFEDALTYYSILRILKVLHILRPFKKFKSMDDMLAVIDYSFWALVSILGLLIFFMGLFSILGLNLYSGILDFRCRTTPVPVAGVWTIASDSTRICGYSYKCPASEYCGSSFEVSAHVTDSSDDIFLQNLNWGLTDFDNFGDALFSVFMIVNGNWGNIMQMISDADNNYIALIYLFLTYIVCKFFIIQLGVAVMLDNFTKIKEKENPKKYLSVNQTTRLEELQTKPDLNSEKITGFHERWRYFTNKYFPSVQVPTDDYYKNPFSYYAYKITAHGSFKYLTILLALINIVIVAIDRYPIDDTQANIIDIFNKVLTILYLIEVFLRITAVSGHRYLQENFNKFEFVVAVLCLVELIGVHSLRAINVLRVFRVMRYMKRDYTWDNFKVLITVVFQAFTYIIDYIILLGIYMYIFAVLGMKYFAGKFKFSDDGHVDLINGSTPRANFDTLYEAYTVVFQVIVGEDVLGAVLSAIRATSWLSTLYFIILVVTGKYVLIQLFLAITLGNFEEARVQVNYGYLTSRFIIFKMFKRKKTKKVRSLASFTNIGQIGEKSLSNILDRSSKKDGDETRAGIIKPQKIRNELDEEIENRKNELLSDENRENSTRKPLVRQGIQRQFTRQRTFNNQDMFQRATTIKVYPETNSVEKGTKQFDDIEMKLTKLQILYKFFKKMRKSSLFIFHKNSLIRQKANAIVSNPVWDTGMLICIILSSILLVLDNPLDDPDSRKSKIYDTINKVFTLLFVIEMILKIIASGFLFHYKDNQKAYIRNEWNILDCIVAVTSTIDVLSGGGNSGLKSLKALRSIRALRPLRVISRNEDLKLIVNALFRTFPSLVNLMVVAGLIMVIGATIGTGLFKGEFHYCTTGASGTPTSFAQIITKHDCISAGGIWLNSDTNYDNFLEAMLTYFKMIIGTDWIGAVYSGVDAVGIEMQPKSWSNYGTIFYFYIFLVIGNVLIRNLFVGVVIDNFRQMKEELGGFLLLNEMQRDWVEMQIFMQRKKLRQIIPEPENSFRKKCFDIAQHPRFTYLVIFIIACNTVILGMKYRTETGSFEDTIDLLNKLFLIIFHIEAIFNIIAFGWFYFKDTWNQFDLLVLFITDVVLILSLVFDNVNIYTVPTVIRALRLGRIVKFIRASKHIRILVDTIFFLLPSLTNIAALLFLMMFIYAVLGMNLFATIKLQTYVNDYANFQDLWSSLNILVRSALGQDWSLFMRELADRTILGCVADQTFDDMNSDGILGCGTYYAYPYFISYVCIVTLILTNLFLAVVVGGYIESKKENEAVISPAQMDEFLEKWAEYDPQGTGLISPEQFAFLIHDLPQPLGLKDNASVRYEYDLTAKKNKGYLISENKKIVLKRVQLFRDMGRFDIPVYNCKVHFSDVCKIISYNAVIKIYKTDPKGESEAHSPEIKVSDEKLEEQLREKLKIKSDYVNRTLAKGWSNRYGILKKLQKNPKGHSPVLVTSFYAGKYILGFIKKWRDEKKTYELQLAEKKGVDYDKTFEYQRRLANAQVVQKLKSVKKGKATRNYDKKKTRRTHPSVNSMTGFSKTQQDDISRQSSLAQAEDAQIPMGSDGSYVSVVSEEEFKSSVLSKGNFEKLIEYKNSTGAAKTPIRRRGSTVSNFAQFRTLQNNEFWLQPVSNTEKFPVPVTVEIDRFMLNYLEQPEIISSRSTATVQDEKDDSEESETLGGDSSAQSSNNNSSFTSSEEEEEKVGENNLQEDQEQRSPPNFKITEFDEEPKETEEPNTNASPEDEEEAANHLRAPFERKASNDSDKPRGLLDAAKADLETIDEEEGEANTRADLDSRDTGKRRMIKPGTNPNGKSYSQFRKKPSFEEEVVDKPTSIAIQSQTDALAVKSNPTSDHSAAASINNIKKEDVVLSEEKLLQGNDQPESAV